MNRLRRIDLWILGIALLALALRAGYFLNVRSDLLFQHPTLDAESYDGWAQVIARGEINSPNVFFLNPGYPYLLGGLYALTGRSVPAAAWLNFCLGALTAVLLVWMGRRLGQAWVGRLAGLAFACYGPAPFYEAQVLSLALMAFVNMAALACLLEWDLAGRRNSKWLVGTGAAFGVSMLLRPNVAPAIVAALAWVAWRAGVRAPEVEDSTRRDVPAPAASDLRLQATLRMGLAVAYVILPVLVRNAIVAREFTGLSTNQGVAFYIGHWRGANGVFGPAPFEQGGLQRQEEDYRREASKRSGRLLTSSESSRFWFREGVRDIVSTPVRWVWLEIRKALLFWNREELAINLDYRFAAERVAWLRAPWIGFGLVAAAALGGLRSTWAAGPGFRLLWGYVGAYMLAVMLAFTAAEYRYPAVPAICLLAAAAAVGLARALKARAAGLPAVAGARELGPWIVAAILVWLPIMRMKRELPLLNLGLLYERAGRTDEAERYYRRALEINPQFALALNSLGLLAYDRRDYPSARDYFGRAILAQPRMIPPQVNLGNTYLQEGRLKDAETVFESTLALDPWTVEAWSNLGVLRARRGDWRKAFEAFERATQIAPNFSDSLYNLAEAAGRLGRWREAAEAYRRVLAQVPTDRDAAKGLREAERRLK